jgi:hypothetical protein
MNRHWLPALLAAAVLAGAQGSLFAGEKDPLPGARDRMKIEAQRVEKEFATERAAAYKLVRSDNPKLVEATEKLQALLAMIRKDASLDAKRRKVLLVTLEWDLDKVKEIAGQRRSASVNSSLNRVARSDARSDARRNDDDRRPRTGGRRLVRDADDIIKSRSRDVRDSRDDRGRFSDRYNRVLKSVADSAVPQAETMKFPRDYAERMKKRGTGIRMTAKEKAIMAALKTTISVDFSNNTFEEVLEYLRKVMKCDISVDKQGMDQAGVKYDSQINLKMRSSARTILKRILADLGLAYYIKDETIQITSIERAKEQTTTRTYYVGDLAMVTDVSIPPALSRLAALQRINMIIDMITSNIEPRSWQIKNPDAPGVITFDPITMSLVIKQTAEVHFMMAGK